MAFVQISASVQTTGASSLSPSLTGVTGGNSLIYCIAMWHASAPASTAPANYTEQVESANNGGGKCAIGARHSAPSGTNTPSIGLASSSWGRAYLLEYDPLTTSEGASSGTGTSTAPSSGAVTPSARSRVTSSRVGLTTIL